MFKSKFQYFIFILAVLLVALAPLYQLLFIHPAYDHLLQEQSEDSAVNHARHLMRELALLELPLPESLTSETFRRELGHRLHDAALLKLRVFDADGRILYSTLPAEIGRVNDKPYFRDIVAKGQVYSKTVRKLDPTAEGELLKQDVVETYVPMLRQGHFAGAFEIYYDITPQARKVELLSRRSTRILLGLGFPLLAALLLALVKASRSMAEREAAERQLQETNEHLEARVGERTSELEEVNQQLAAEVAERREAENALRHALIDSEAAKNKIDAILRSVQDGLLVVDPQQHILLINPVACRWLDIGASHPVGLPLELALTHPYLQGVLLRWLRRGASSELEFDLTSPGGNGTQVFRARSFPLEARAGEVGGRIVLIQNITREREVERMKNEFLAMAAHELQTPLTAIIGFSELLTDPELVQADLGQQQEFAGYIRDKAESLARIVNDLLDISMIESGQTLAMDQDEFVLDEIIRGLASHYRGVSPGHSFALTLPDSPLQLCADAGRIRQVLENLISNAVKYSPRGTEIRIGAVVEQQRCRVSVADQGVGMTPEQVERVFDKFYRADGSNTAAPGTGLGMSIVKYIVEAHGGQISVASRPGQGTLIQFTLPLRQSAVASGSNG